jgi:hypothetical protein
VKGDLRLHGDRYRRGRSHGDRNVLVHRHRPAAADAARVPERRGREGAVERSRVQRPDAERPSGGFSLLSVQVKNVNLPDGTQLWVTLDFGPVGTITLRGGSGTMAAYNMGRFGVTRDQIRVNSALPDISGAQQILIGGSFQ